MPGFTYVGDRSETGVSLFISDIFTGTHAVCLGSRQRSASGMLMIPAPLCDVLQWAVISRGCVLKSSDTASFHRACVCGSRINFGSSKDPSSASHKGNSLVSSHANGQIIQLGPDVAPRLLPPRCDTSATLDRQLRGRIFVQ